MAENQIRNLKKLAEARGLEGTGIPAGFDKNVGTSVRFAPGEQPPAGMSQLEAEILGRKTPAKMTTTRGANVEDISDHAEVLRERFRRAQVEAGKLMDKVSKSKKSGEKLDINDEKFAKPFNDLIDHVRTVASNAGKNDGGDPTVLADVASALVSLDPQTRSMVLRRAGNPEVFEPLRDGELPPTPEGGIGDEMKKVQVAAQVDADERAMKRHNSVQSLPQIKRPSSVFSRPDSLITKGARKGEIQPSSEQYKSFATRDHSPLSVPAGRESQDSTLASQGLTAKQMELLTPEQRTDLSLKGLTEKQVKALGGKPPPELMPDTPLTQSQMDALTPEQRIALFPQTTTQRAALWRLAGKELRQVNRIEKKYGEGNAMLRPYISPSEEPPLLKGTGATPSRKPTAMQAQVLESIAGEPLSAEDLAKRAGVKPDVIRRMQNAGLLQFAGQTKEVPKGQQFKTPPTGGEAGGKEDKRIANLNRGTHEKLLEMMYSATPPIPASDAQDGGAIMSQRLLAPATTIDLDRFFPWWRGRFGEVDDSGQLAYPPRMPTAEFVTGMIEGQLGVQDPQFFDRMLPLIQRSIDTAADAPDPNYRPAGGQAKTAHEYSQMVFLPSKQFQKTMQSGVGSADYPYAIYGDREVPRDPVTAPERHPFAKAQAEAASSGGVEDFRRLMGTESAAPDAAAPEESSGGVEEFRRLMQDRPALGDQSSIYRVRPASPLSALLA